MTKFWRLYLMQQPQRKHYPHPRHNQQKHGKKAPVSYFIHGIALLAVFLFGMALIQNIIGLVSPKTLSKEVLAFSSTSHLEYYCADKAIFDEDYFSGDICSLLEKKTDTKEIEAVVSKYKDISTTFVRQNFLENLLENGFMVLGLLLFLRYYRRETR
ncbi:MAG: hypothetical protein ACTSXV_00980 [Alphaproteobacteria bacterium]